MRACAIVPALNAADTVGEVVTGLLRAWPSPDATILVIDDGSTDRTNVAAAAAGASVVRHEANLGKGAALLTGLREAARLRFDVVVSVDADGQHPADQAVRLLDPSLPQDDLILGVRDLVAAGAPRSSMFGNRASNYWLNLFTELRLIDTQCGLRRYPVARTLALSLRDPGFGLEAEVILRAAADHINIVEVPVRVIYPPEGSRTTHYRSWVDSTKIVLRVIVTALGD